MDAPVEDKILDILLVDGQRGWPSLVQRLLLLNVVGSNPLHRANPEHDIPCSVANFSMARHISSCVIFSPLLHKNSIPQQANRQQAPFPRKLWGPI